MTDGFGSNTYQYDQLSRLVSETRIITEINKSYTLNYGYNLAGQATSVSDPADTNRDVTYLYNQAGRLTTVNGNGFGGVTQYASNLQYRAWGALKHLTYGTGSGKNLDNLYNSRMQISRFEVNTMLGSIYQYSPDGRIKFVDDISMETPASDKFDRSFAYDQVGRLIEAKSGTEAHTPPVATTNRPYNETFGFDEWNNLTARTGQVWTEGMDPVSAEYTDNRRQGWQYDADGRPTLENTLEHKYDASGRMYWTKDTMSRGHFNPGLTISQGFDGDGQRLKQQEYNTATYMIRSSVLGEVVWEIGLVNSIWQKKTGFVYGGGRMLAMQTIGMWGGQPGVGFRYQNPVTGSVRGPYPTELDPLGLNAGLAAPEGGPIGGGDAPDLVVPRFGDILNGSTGCTIDGAMVSCDTAASAVEMGIAKVLLKGVSPGLNPYYDTGKPGFEGWVRYDPNVADAGICKWGMCGMVPIGTKFVGNGFFERGQFQTIEQFWIKGFLSRLIKQADKENVSTKDLTRFILAFNEAVRRLSNPDCAKPFGGFRSAIRALTGATYRFKNLGEAEEFGTHRNYVPPAISAQRVGNIVTINTAGSFMSINGMIAVPSDPGYFARGAGVFPVRTSSDGSFAERTPSTDVGIAAFILLHELGHLTNIFRPDGGNGYVDILAQSENNEKVWEPCFSD